MTSSMICVNQILFLIFHQHMPYLLQSITLTFSHDFEQVNLNCVSTMFSTHNCKCLPGTNICSNVSKGLLNWWKGNVSMCFKPIDLSPTSNVYLDSAQGPKMVRNTFKILHQMVHNNESVFDYFEMLCIKGLKSN